MKSLRLAGLDARVVTPVPLGDGAASEQAGCVVLLHGYGAPGTDLVPLARELRAPAGTRFVFPAAPHALEMGLPAPYAGRAWWHIDMLRLQMAVQTRSLEALANHRPPGIDEARQALSAFLDALYGELGVAPERLVLGGFSQGAMLSCDLALAEERPLAGLVLLSGSFISRADWLAGMGKRQGLPVFQSHSPDDQVLPLQLAEELHAALRAAGADAELVRFRGGHGIGNSVLEGLSQFLSRVLS